jgi:TatD DNase family protein
MPVFYDTHAHLTYRDFAGDIADVIARAHQAGITRVVTIGTDRESSHAALELADKFRSVFAVIGWHPGDASRAPNDWRPELRQLAAHPKVVALGETGLDYYRLPSLKDGFTSADDDVYKRKQQELFVQHLEVAVELGLNCVIHQRDTARGKEAPVRTVPSVLDDTLALLKPYSAKVRGVFHCFAGDVAALHRVLEIGSIVSFTGILTFKNGQNVRDALAATPMEKFMLETDSPFLAPLPYRGKRCEPAYVKEISEVAGQVKGCSLEELSAATCATAHEFFHGLGD